MIEINPTSSTQKDLYKLLIGAIVPRPIAFVSTCGDDGSCNLAPFSFFSGVASNPPSLMFSCANTPSKEKKDTLRNIEERKEFVVNSANEWLIEPLVASAADYPYGVDEMREVGLTPVDSKIVAPPRVQEAAIQFECKLLQLVPVGDGSPGSSTVIIGEIVYAHIREDCYKDGKIPFENYHPVSRLGGLSYGKGGELFEMAVPKVEKGGETR
jgi:flavin reductase (DIM6/NTAB) family NADH-FMN oxidoreductase RutF